MKLCHDIEIDCCDITKSKKKEVYRDIENSIAIEASTELENLCRNMSPHITTDHSTIDTTKHETMS